ncbi:MAG: hypothetical protein DRH04_00265 [Deltaproteobacteria bacterium]|nr:MAG: hypothetical protein DRH04_00265 [Deltaproteobacteria bacterium]
MYKAADYNFFSYRLTTVEPLNIGGGEQIGNLRKTLDYISGATIRGRLAALHIREYGPPENQPTAGDLPDFRSLFISGEVIFSNAYPCHPEMGGNAIPMPGTVLGCKYFGNLAPNGLPADNHGLVETVAREPDKEFKCPHDGCDDPPRRREGYLSNIGGKLYNFAPPRRVDNHNNHQSEDFFAVESLETGCSFDGWIAVGKDLPAAVSGFLHRHIRNGSEHRLGAAKSPGNGLCSFGSLVGVEDGQHFFTTPGKGVKDELLHVFCHGDLIIRDNADRFSAVLPAARLHSDLEPVPERSYWKTGSTRRFITGLGMPDSTRLTIRKGSVFTYRWRKDVENPELPLAVGESPEYGHGLLIYNHHLRDTP